MKNQNILYQFYFSSQDPVQFILPKIRSNGVYRMDLAVLSLELKIVKSSNPSQNVPKEASVAPANNVVNSIWSRSALYLNSVPVNSSTQGHHMKAMLHQLLTTDRMEKEGLYAEGYHYTQAAFVEQERNPSYVARKRLFVDPDTGEYTRHARLVGFIYHDLVLSNFVDHINQTN